MHWVIQKGIFKPANYEALVSTVDRLGIPYTPVTIASKTLILEPDINIEGKVYVCGAVKMAKISAERGWNPGSFLNNNFEFSIWHKELSSQLLNDDVIYGKFGEIELGENEKYFIRPSEDNKAFDGMVIDAEMHRAWKKEQGKQSIMAVDVIVSSVKEIYREFRLFVVDYKIVTGSLYKQSGKPMALEGFDSDVEDFTNEIIEKWSPCGSYVIDIAHTPRGFKVIEFNNINSSGFYACDISRYVQAIELAYG
ncbi:MAG: ATP-grasp domain-containing protein [Gammaproteobacteria bacterium]|nr:ATP-grasp domain-containing protein [Gammaproteobacteria bacterium]MDH5652852.1 ATP-grasp domain-containing protein [Gammaproteobacteria bacterium]